MTDYDMLCGQLRSLTDGVPYRIANLANASALLYQTLNYVNWAGFYLMEEGKLVLGPFQGRPACVEIAQGRGVCGTAVEMDAVQVVADVHDFPGHIACDRASRSEIVIPLHAGEEIFGVLDIDSPEENRFTTRDREGLEAFAAVLEEIW